MRVYLSYITSIKGELGNEWDNRSSINKLSSAFNTLLVNIEDSKENTLDSYFTLV